MSPRLFFRASVLIVTFVMAVSVAPGQTCQGTCANAPGTPCNGTADCNGSPRNLRDECLPGLFSLIVARNTTAEQQLNDFVQVQPGQRDGYWAFYNLTFRTQDGAM